MTKFYLFVLLAISGLNCFADEKTEFNWIEQIISIESSIRGITTLDNGSSFIVGVSPTVAKTNSGLSSWETMNIYNPKWKFNHLSFFGDVGYATSSKAVAIDGDTDLCYNGVLLKSSDKGQTWVEIPRDSIGSNESAELGLAAPGVFNITYSIVHCISKDTAYLTATWQDCAGNDFTSHSSIFKTTNGGGNWKNISSDLGTTSIISLEQMGNYLYVGASKKLYKYDITTDEVEDLDPLLNIVEEKMVIYGLDALNDSTMIVTTTSDGIYKTNNSGESFTKIEGPNGGFDTYVVSDSVIVVIGTSSRSVATNDGGQTWSNCYPGDTPYLFGDIVNDSLIALCKNNIFKIAVSDLESGIYDTWKSQIICEGSRLKAMHTFEDGSNIIATYEASIIRSEDQTTTWQACEIPNDLAQELKIEHGNISSYNNSILLSTRTVKRYDFDSGSDFSDYKIDGYLLWSDDNLETYTVQKNKYFGKKYEDIISANPTADGAYAIDIYTTKIVDSLTAYVYCGWDYKNPDTEEEASYGRILKTSDRGATWDTITPDLGPNFITEIEFKGDIAYFIGNKTVYKTEDGGLTVIDLYPKLVELADASIYCSSIQMIEDDTIYISTTSDGIFYSYDGGETFATIEGATGANAVIAFSEKEILTVGSSSKTKFTRDFGQSWEECYPGSTSYGCQLVEDTIVAFAKGRIYKLPVSDLSIQSSSEQISSNHVLNIYNHSDKLVVSMQNSKIDHCRLFSISGQSVFNSRVSTSTIEISKQAIPHGVYILSVQCGDVIETRKIMMN